jgi:hypothetical protein
MNGQLPRVKRKVLLPCTLSISLVAKMQDSVCCRTISEKSTLSNFPQPCIFCRVAYRTTNSRGYKGYAAGHEPGQGDVVQNLAKIRLYSGLTINERRSPGKKQSQDEGELPPAKAPRWNPGVHIA